MVFTTGLSEPEGPVCLPDGSWLVAEMGASRGCITHISADGRDHRIIARTGRPNGLAVDRHGIIWVAESGKPALLRVTMGGQVQIFLKECAGTPFLFPNDLAFGPEGDLYLTDSGILFRDFAPGGQVRPDPDKATYDGKVYKINVRTGAIREIDAGLRFANGIAFGPDRNLYVNEMITANIYRYGWRDGEIVGGREYFGNVADPASSSPMRHPDGMKFSADGNLYVAVVGQGDVTVLGRDGTVVRRLKTAGSMPTNVAFGAPGSHQIYVTEVEGGTLETFDVGVDGLPLYAGA